MSEHLAGTTKTFEIALYDYAGALVDADNIVINVEQPGGGYLYEDVVPVHVAQGRYEYEFVIPSDADPGTWSGVWEATRDGVLQIKREDITVVSAGSLLTDPYSITGLRLLLWEQIPEGGTEADTNFTDTQLALVLAMGNGVLSRAAAIGWSIKGGKYSKMIDISESGSNRRLNQLFTNCERMWKQFSVEAEKEETLVLAAGSRAVGAVGFSILGDSAPAELVSLFASYKMDSVNIRAFPLKRFPAILQ